VNSIRTIPVIPSTLALLQQYKKQIQNQHPNAILKDAFLFPNKENIFLPRDPNSGLRGLKSSVRS